MQTENMWYDMTYDSCRDFYRDLYDEVREFNVNINMDEFEEHFE